jgi:hypothetical protein
MSPVIQLLHLEFKTATAVFILTLYNFQYSAWLNTKSQSYTIFYHVTKIKFSKNFY